MSKMGPISLRGLMFCSRVVKFAAREPDASRGGHAYAWFSEGEKVVINHMTMLWRPSLTSLFYRTDAIIEKAHLLGPTT